MKQNYHIDDTFLARWLNNELTKEELSDFIKSEEYPLYKKIAKKSTLFKVPEFNEEQSFVSIKEKLANKKQKVRKLMPNWIYGIAAAVLVLFGLSYFINNGTDVICSSGEQLAYILPDGSEVLLKGNSEIHFVEKKWKNNKRVLELEGEAYFKVKKGSVFSVETNGGIVTVVGTQFNVQTAENYLGVECYEGKVKVKNILHETLLTPGKGIKFIDDKKEGYNISHNFPNWTVSIYEYNAVPLSIIFSDLENIYKVKVENNKVDLSQLYSGKLVKNNLEKALQIVCKPMNIKYVVSKNEITISE